MHRLVYRQPIGPNDLRRVNKDKVRCFWYLWLLDNFVCLSQDPLVYKFTMLGLLLSS